MKNQFPIFFLILIFFNQSCGINKIGISEKDAQKYIETNIKSEDTLSSYDILISKCKALRVAKSNIYKTYGFWNITCHEKPFKKYFVGKYLYLGGTISKKRKGGVFWIVIDRKNGELKTICHSK